MQAAYIAVVIAYMVTAQWLSLGLGGMCNIKRERSYCILQLFCNLIEMHQRFKNILTALLNKKLYHTSHDLNLPWLTIPC